MGTTLPKEDKGSVIKGVMKVVAGMVTLQKAKVIYIAYPTTLIQGISLAITVFSVVFLSQRAKKSGL